MLERIVLKNAADWTSQRLKRTSGAQVMIISSFPKNLDFIKSIFLGVRLLYVEILYLLRLVALKIST